MENFILSPLPTDVAHNSFRIITILADAENHQLRCLVSHEVLKQCEPYEALSYCYGSGPRDQLIMIRDSQSPGDFGALHIMSNLHAAMKELRDLHEPKRIWIDALCINQDDHQEKISQIKLMRTIYRDALRVVIWLGEAADDSDEALRLVPYVIEVMKEDRRTGFKRDLTYILHRPPEFPPMVDPIWRFLEKILSRPWFKRAWIVQEIALAREAIIMCGSSKVAWDDFREVFEYFLTARCYLLGLDTDGLCMLLQHDDTRSRVARKESGNLLHVLIRNRTQIATHPLDTIYAFHSLFERNTPGSLATMPNYSISYRELSLNIAYAILHETQNLDILACSRHPLDGNPDDVPSWVPAWGSKTSVESLRWRQIEPGHTSHTTPNYCASAESSCRFALSDDDSKLHLFGFTVTRIKKLSEPYTGHVLYDFDAAVMLSNHRMLESYEEVVCSDLDPLHEFKHLTEVTQAMELGKPFQYQSNPYENIVHAFYMTMLAGILYGMEKVAINVMFSLWYMNRIEVRTLINTAELEGLDLQEMMLNHIEEKSSQNAAIEAMMEGMGLEECGPLAMTTVVSQFSTMIQCCGYRRMMKTDDGALGLVPYLAEEGDAVVLVAGGKTPFILREKPRNSSHHDYLDSHVEYEFIGEAYVHGFMDGTEWLTLRLRTTAMEEFVLV